MFEVYIRDQRWGVPTLHFPVAADLNAAVLWALDYLSASPHHIDAEVWTDGARVASLKNPRAPSYDDPEPGAPAVWEVGMGNQTRAREHPTLRSASRDVADTDHRSADLTGLDRRG